MMHDLLGHPFRTLEVALGDRRYEILTGAQIFDLGAEVIAKLMPARRAVVVTDTQVARCHLPKFAYALERSGIAFEKIVLSSGEGTKSFPVLVDLVERILACRPDRKTVLIALGGGVIGDITGFAASIVLRGLPYVQVPTTLLAQVDSSVGGKTGINTRYGKNMVGTFYQPRLVIADVGTLTTLPAREFRAGYAEIVKYGLINDVAFFHWLEHYGQHVLSGEPQALTEAVHYCMAAKSAIVAQDETEQGMRALLNLGHTFAHALEAETGFGEALLHGEAVAVGLVMAFAFSHWLGHCPESDARRIQQHLQTAGLPTSPFDIRPDWSAERLLVHMAQDKKAENGSLTFILARSIGDAFVAKGILPEHVLGMMKDCFGLTG